MRQPPVSKHLAQLVVVAMLSAVTVASVDAQSAPGSAGAKLASKCQQAIIKANGKHELSAMAQYQFAGVVQVHFAVSVGSQDGEPG